MTRDGFSPRARGLVAGHRWLLMRRGSQASIMALFLVGPLTGWWVVTGNLSSSLTLGVLPLTDPYMLLQTLFAGHAAEAATLIGAAIVVAVYLVLGGRAYCAWVCPLNVVTDTARALRRRLGLRGGARLAANTRYWVLAMTLVVALATETAAWELVNPVSMLHRALVFGFGLAWAVVLAVFLFDLLVGERGWCGHLCPVGAFYSLLGAVSLVRIGAVRRDDCNDCKACFAVCPEPQVIHPALKGTGRRAGGVILSPNCTNCGGCIDVCPTRVFAFTTRFHDRAPYHDRKSHTDRNQEYVR